LLTFIGGTSHHIAYPILAHVKLLVTRCPGAYDDQFKAFFLRHNDPLCVKVLKLEILAKLANPANGGESLNELSEYVSDANTEIAKKSVRTIGHLAITVEEVNSFFIFGLILKNFL
jgi:vesicle coat complex subunit